MFGIGLAGGPPGIGQKVRAGNGDEASVSGVEVAIAPSSGERAHDYIFHARAKRFLGLGEIARILAPYRAKAGFHRALGRRIGDVDAESLAEAHKPGPVLFGAIDAGVKGGVEEVAYDVARPNGACEYPAKTVFRRDRRVRGAGILRLHGSHQRRLIWLSGLAWLVRLARLARLPALGDPGRSLGAHNGRSGEQHNQRNRTRAPSHRVITGEENHAAPFLGKALRHNSGDESMPWLLVGAMV